MAKAVLPTLPISGRVTTADALHTHAAFMQLIPDHRGKCVLTVKQTQPTRHADLAVSFADPHASCQSAETWDRSLGRVEHRVIRVSSEMNASLSPGWPHVTQVAEVTRTVTKKGVTSTEVVSLITDLSPQLASPLQLLAFVRGHWGIANRSHYGRSVSFQQDRSRLRTPNAPQILAACRKSSDHSAASLWLVPDFLRQTFLFLSSRAGSCPSLFHRRPALMHRPRFWSLNILQCSLFAAIFLFFLSFS